MLIDRDCAVIKKWGLPQKNCVNKIIIPHTFKQAKYFNRV